MDPNTVEPTGRKLPWQGNRVGLLTAFLILAALIATASAASPARSAIGAGVSAPEGEAQVATGVEATTSGATTFTVAATGDFLIHGAVFRRAQLNGQGTYDFRPMFRYIEPFISKADLAICHFETAMTRGRPSGYPSFNTPRQLAADAKAAGWDLCDTASNHTLDKGHSGVRSTIRAVRAAGLQSHGSARNARESHQIPMVSVKGVNVSLLAYTDSTNGISLPKPWSVNLLDPDQIKSDAARAKRAGARVVVVNLHWGAEYRHKPTRRQRQVARELTASPNIDAIIGQHAHVVQPIRWKHGKPIVYGEGNLVSNQSASCCAVGSTDGIIARLHFVVRGEKVRVRRVSYVPITVRQPDYGVIPTGLGIRQDLMDSQKLRASYQRTVSVIGRSKRVRPIPYWPK